MRKLPALLLLVLLAACTFAPRDTGLSFMFALQPAQTEQPAGSNAAKDNLIVFAPTTSPELDTYRIALNRNGQRWDYYAGARWADFLPLVVQDNITKTLDESHLFNAAATDDSGLTGDKILKTEIRAFQAQYTAGQAAPLVKIRLTFSLVSRLDRRPLASFTIKAEQRAAANNLSAIQAAFSSAFDKAQQHLVEKMDKVHKQ